MNQQKLFDDVVRTEDRSKRESETLFSYYNGSAREQVRALRALLGEWFARYPDFEKPDLRARLRSDDTNFNGAFWELYLHELVTRMGYQVQLHPDIEGEANHPDFLVLSRGQGLFYMEATAAGPSHQDIASTNREAVVYDVLNRLDSPDFFLLIRVEGAPQTPPPAAKLRKQLQAWLRTLDYDDIQAALEAGDLHERPVFNWEHGGWRLTIGALPKGPEARGKPGVRPIGMRSFPPQWVNSWPGIASSISQKSKKYKRLKLPLIVALNILDEMAETIDVMNALLGEECVVIRHWPDGTCDEPVEERKRNGVWIGPQGPRNRRVSAVLVAYQLSPWTVHRSPVLIHHPWANRPLPPALWPLAQEVPVLQFKKLDARPVTEFLALPDPWPPERL